jgi:hypothetical protein
MCCPGVWSVWGGLCGAGAQAGGVGDAEVCVDVQGVLPVLLCGAVLAGGQVRDSELMAQHQNFGVLPSTNPPGATT